MIFEEHKQLKGTPELQGKSMYVKLAHGLPTFGVHFFLVQEQQKKGKHSLVPRLLGVSKDAILRLDENTKVTITEWPLKAIKRCAVSANVFLLKFEDNTSSYSVKTVEGQQIKELIQGYISIAAEKERQRLGGGYDPTGS